MMRTVAAAGLFVVACMPAASAQQPTGNPIVAATPIFDATTEPMRRMPGSRISRSSASSITT